MQVPLCTHSGAWEESHLNAVVPSPPTTPTPLIPTPLCLFSFSLCFSLLSVLGSMDLHALVIPVLAPLLRLSRPPKSRDLLRLYRLWQSCWAPFSQWKEVFQTSNVAPPWPLPQTYANFTRPVPNTLEGTAAFWKMKVRNQRWLSPGPRWGGWGQWISKAQVH